MTNQERFTRALRGLGGLDRLPMVEWAPYWDQLTSQWEGQGFPKGLANHEIEAYFGLDSLRQIWIRPRADACPGRPAIAVSRTKPRLAGLYFP